MKKIEYDDINTWGTIATFTGLFISVITLVIANSVRKVTRELQRSFLFDKRVPLHLKQIQEILTNFNNLLNDVNDNVNQLKILSGQLRGELQSLSIKITDAKAKALITKGIKEINKIIRSKYVPLKAKEKNQLRKIYNWIFRITESNFWDSYNTAGEIHRSIDNLYKDKKAQVKKND